MLKTRKGLDSRPKPQSEEEKEFKAAIRDRDGHTCQRCGVRAWEVHHLLTNGAHGDELRFDANNCLTLCESCHRTARDSAHKDPAAFNRWAADEFPRFAPLYAQFGKGDAYEEWAIGREVDEC